MTSAIFLGSAIVTTYAVVGWTGLHRNWVDYALFAANVLGIGATVALARVDRPFLKAFVVSGLTSLCVTALEYIDMTTGPTSTRPWVMPPA